MSALGQNVLKTRQRWTRKKAPMRAQTSERPLRTTRRRSINLRGVGSSGPAGESTSGSVANDGVPRNAALPSRASTSALSSNVLMSGTLRRRREFPPLFCAVRFGCHAALLGTALTMVRFRQSQSRDVTLSTEENSFPLSALRQQQSVRRMPGSFRRARWPRCRLRNFARTPLSAALYN
jgi:hypothetical protein